MARTTVFQLVLESLPARAHHRRAWLGLVRCFSSIERVLMQHFAEKFNSSLPRYDVLTALALTPGKLTMGDLAAMLMVTKGNITGGHDRAELFPHDCVGGDRHDVGDVHLRFSQHRRDVRPDLRRLIPELIGDRAVGGDGNNARGMKQSGGCFAENCVGVVGGRGTE